MKALVTDATGILGRRLIERLLHDHHDVFVLRDAHDQASRDASVAGCDVIFNVQTSADHNRFAAQNHNIVRTTHRLLASGLEHNIRSFVHVGSIAVYQACGNRENALLDERAPLEPKPEAISLLCRAHVEAEEFAWSFHKRGLPVTIIRAGILYGPGCDPILPQLGRVIAGRALVMPGSPRRLLPLAHVENIIDALILAAQCDVAVGEAFNIVDGHGINRRAYLRLLARITGRRFVVLPVPTALLSGCAGVRELLVTWGLASRRGPTRYSAQSACASLRYSTAKANALLNWEPRIATDEGLRETFIAHRTGRIPSGSPIESDAARLPVEV